jgi:hypothetical protein
VSPKDVGRSRGEIDERRELLEAAFAKLSPPARAWFDQAVALIAQGMSSDAFPFPDHPMWDAFTERVSDLAAEIERTSPAITGTIGHGERLRQWVNWQAWKAYIVFVRRDPALAERLFYAVGPTTVSSAISSADDRGGASSL